MIAPGRRNCKTSNRDSRASSHIFLKFGILDGFVLAECLKRLVPLGWLSGRGFHTARCVCRDGFLSR
jgi:hypothetical protein